MKNYLNQAVVILKTRFAKRIWDNRPFWTPLDIVIRNNPNPPGFFAAFFWDSEAYVLADVDRSKSRRDATLD